MSSKKQSDESLGRFLSLVLRHQPQAAYITLDRHGWADIEKLLAGCVRAGKSMDRETLERIVRENSKQRYSLSPDGKKIRANQGHSIPVELELREAEPPSRLYHGTATRFLESIRREGITRQSRQQVHLSATVETAAAVGARHGSPVVLPPPWAGTDTPSGFRKTGSGSARRSPGGMSWRRSCSIPQAR